MKKIPKILILTTAIAVLAAVVAGLVIRSASVRTTPRTPTPSETSGVRAPVAPARTNAYRASGTVNITLQ